MCPFAGKPKQGFEPWTPCLQGRWKSYREFVVGPRNVRFTSTFEADSGASHATTPSEKISLGHLVDTAGSVVLDRLRDAISRSAEPRSVAASRLAINGVDPGNPGIRRDHVVTGGRS